MESNDELVDRLKSEGVLYDASVEEAMRHVDRVAFVDPAYARDAYEDRPLPTKLGQTLSAPHMVVIMSQHLMVGRGMRVLEVGAGSGYHAAVLSELVGPEGEVYAVERFPELAALAKRRLSPYSNVRVSAGDGSGGLKKFAPFDRILVTCAAVDVPKQLAAQLSDGGKMVIPVGHGAVQRLTLVEKLGGKVRKTDLGCSCAFVPML